MGFPAKPAGTQDSDVDGHHGMIRKEECVSIRGAERPVYLCIGDRLKISRQQFVSSSPRGREVVDPTSSGWPGALSVSAVTIIQRSLRLPLTCPPGILSPDKVRGRSGFIIQTTNYRIPALSVCGLLGFCGGCSLAPGPGRGHETRRRWDHHMSSARNDNTTFRITDRSRPAPRPSGASRAPRIDRRAGSP